MKALFCQQCGDIVAPFPEPTRSRECLCGRHRIWWVDPARGIVRVCDTLGGDESVRERDGRPLDGYPRAWILGFTNALLHHPSRCVLSSDEVEQAIDGHDSHYLFKRHRSLIIRIRPGQTGDSGWAIPPEWPEPSDEVGGST